jgi:glycosyltransferase involved in cell wall biosynthesis
MSLPNKISIIISTYNSPEYLKPVFESLSCQTDHAFEIVIADDGSGNQTRQLIANYANSIGVPLIHAWQEDNGFRAAAARNNAVRLATGDYLTFLDGDCLALPNFVARQRSCAEKGYMVRGSRVMLREQYTRTLLSASTIDLPKSLFQWMSVKLSGGVKRIAPLIRLPYAKYGKAEKWDGVKTCNLGIWREDFEAINGFDERYVGWGHEDADLAVRLIRSGIKRKEGRSEVPVIHLWHEENDRTHLSDNETRLSHVLSADYTWIKPGLIN